MTFTSKTEIDILTRELIIVSILIIKKRPRQLYSHMRGALRVGASQQDLRNLFNNLQKRLNPGFMDEAEKILEKIKIDH